MPVDVHPVIVAEIQSKSKGADMQAVLVGVGCINTYLALDPVETRYDILGYLCVGSRKECRRYLSKSLFIETISKTAPFEKDRAGKRPLYEDKSLYVGFVVGIELMDAYDREPEQNG
jgi:hypothetical protein